MGEQVELTIKSTHPNAIHWGLQLDKQLRLAQPRINHPAADSRELVMLIGWTLVGVNGRPVKSPQDCAEYLGRLAHPGETITLRARAPAPVGPGPGPTVQRRQRPQLHRVAPQQPDDADGAAAAAPVGAPPAPSHSGLHTETCRLIVRQLSNQTPLSVIEEAFGRFGRIVDVHIPRGSKGRMRANFGFVEYQSEAQAQKAVEYMDGKQLTPGTLPIVVKIAEGRPQSRSEMMIQRDPRYDMLRKEQEGSNPNMAAAAKRARDEADGLDPHALEDIGDTLAAASRGVVAGGRGVDMDTVAGQLRRALEQLGQVRSLSKQARQEKEQGQAELRQVQQSHMPQADSEAARALEKYKARMEKYRTAERERASQEVERKRRALSAGAEEAADEDLALLTRDLGSLTAADAWAVLGLAPEAGDPQAVAKRLMAKLHPDRVPLGICKDGLRARFQLVQHARDLLATPAAGPATPSAAADDNNEA